MDIDKDKVMEMVRSKGDQNKTDQAEKELPDKVDPAQHADLLARFGINPKDLMGKLGGLGGKLGG